MTIEEKEIFEFSFSAYSSDPAAFYNINGGIPVAMRGRSNYLEIQRVQVEAEGDSADFSGGGLVAGCRISAPNKLNGVNFVNSYTAGVSANVGNFITANSYCPYVGNAKFSYGPPGSGAGLQFTLWPYFIYQITLASMPTFIRYYVNIRYALSQQQSQ